MQDTAIFQRTESGRTEIKTKMHGLTQSERLALIVIDGATPYAEMRQKLKGLTGDRFDRALTNLLKKELIIEVLLQVGDAEGDEFDSATIDKFLHQDPMDPVTIIMFDPEEELDLDMAEEGAVAPAPVDVKEVAHNLPPLSTPLKKSVPPVVSSPSGSQTLKITSVDFYVPIEKAPKAGDPVADRVGPTERVSPSPLRKPSAVNSQPSISATKLPWGKIVIVIGVLILIGSFIVKMLR